MLKKRLIFTLLVDDGQFQLSRNFSLQKVGNLDWLLNTYKAEAILHSIDELIILNVSKKRETFDSFICLLETLSQKCFMPITAGGGIREIAQVKRIFRAGADKIILNTALFSDKAIVHHIVKNYGSQSLVASLDYKKKDKAIIFYNQNGQHPLDLSIESVLDYLSEIKIGELYLTSMERDGTGRGYDIETLHEVSKKVTVPLIASGGVGKFEHLYEGLQIENVSAVSTANLFNFIGDGLRLAREYLCKQSTLMACWDYKEALV